VEGKQVVERVRRQVQWRIAFQMEVALRHDPISTDDAPGPWLPKHHRLWQREQSKEHPGF
jgi:hypothetical protein